MTQTSITVAELPVGEVLANPNQPRKTFDGIDQLAASIEANGLLQPITVRPLGGRFEIVAGERRFRAIQTLGWDTVPAIIRPVAAADVFQLSVLENVARKQMNPVEEAMALQQLMETGLSAAELERRLGFGSGDGGEVTYKVRILGAFDALLGLVAKGQFPVPMAVQIAKLSNFSQRKAFQEWQEKGLSQNAFTALVDALFAAERQQEMFAETKLTDATRAQADRLMIALRNLERHAGTISAADLQMVGEALFHRDTEIQMLCDAGIAALTRIRRSVQRTEGRVAAVRLFDEAEPMDE